VKGDDIIDTVCIYKKEGYCAEEFRFLSVDKVDAKMLSVDGVIGLAPDEPTNGPSFIATLQNQSIINRKMFGLIMGPRN
jgi:hypothetical protein